GQHALVVGVAVDLKLVDEHQVAPPLLKRHGGLLGQRCLEETQQDDADQFRQVGSHDPLAVLTSSSFPWRTTSRRSRVERGWPRMRRATRELANLESLVITEEVISRCWWASMGS